LASKQLFQLNYYLSLADETTQLMIFFVAIFKDTTLQTAFTTIQQKAIFLF